MFVTSKDPKALAAWYRDVLGIPLESWGGAKMAYDAPGHPPIALWNAMPTNSEEVAPSKRDFMVGFAVDDLGVRIERMLFDGAPVPEDGAIRPDLSRPGIGIALKHRDAERYAD